MIFQNNRYSFLYYKICCFELEFESKYKFKMEVCSNVFRVTKPT